ncbi:uncharacterized protein LOC116601377 isoform X2 [Nematostella vectensis]|uniref:uncharacterized protein LOC116601377 isoform X2 n=1 Tax=Nematostella vectensis TaxID=45351 RepID=UPI002076F761|nr:uncharacterized protein LOC116601377 isoform X2 [Nematostella vectensis]
MIGEIHNNNKSSTDSNAPVKKKKSSKNTPPATTVTGTVESCDQIAETLEDISIVAINERSTQRAGCELNQSEQIVQSASRDLSTSSLKGVTRDKPAHAQRKYFCHYFTFLFHIYIKNYYPQQRKYFCHYFTFLFHIYIKNYYPHLQGRIAVKRTVQYRLQNQMSSIQVLLEGFRSINFFSISDAQKEQNKGHFAQILRVFPREMSLVS